MQNETLESLILQAIADLKKLHRALEATRAPSEAAAGTYGAPPPVNHGSQVKDEHHLPRGDDKREVLHAIVRLERAHALSVNKFLISCVAGFPLDEELVSDLLNSLLKEGAVSMDGLTFRVTPRGYTLTDPDVSRLSRKELLERVCLELDSKQTAILRLLYTRSPQSRNELLRTAKLTEASIRKELWKLEEKSLIQRYSGDRYSYGELLMIDED